jgi:hypothetical protein
VTKSSISTLVGKLLDKGIVEKGLKGELYARLILIPAHDSRFKNVSSGKCPAFMKGAFQSEGILKDIVCRLVNSRVRHENRQDNT